MNAEKTFLKPADGRAVRREDGSPWPVHGDWTATTLFVRRRLADGDLVAADPDVAAHAIAREAEAAAQAEAAAEAAATAEAAAAQGASPEPAPQDTIRKPRRAAAADE